MISIPDPITRLVPDSSLFEVRTGVEAEGVRVTPDACIARTPHPAVYGNKLTNPYITIDYCEQQVEVISPALVGDENTFNFVSLLREIVQQEAHTSGELLWPFSLPPRLPVHEDDIEIGIFDDSPRGRASRAYREDLAVRYGKKQQLISGVHYNFSFDERLIATLGEHNEVYMKVARNYHRFAWLLVYLLGASPQPSPENPFSVSKRNGSEGYRNHAEIFPDCSSLNNYITSVRRFVEQGLLSAPKELYSPIRLKPKDPQHLLESLEQDGIAYLEIRSVDLNPFEMAGITRLDLAFLHAFVLYLLFAEEPPTYACWLKDADTNVLRAADRGLDPDTVIKSAGGEVSLHQEAVRILEEITELAGKLGLSDDVRAGVEAALNRAQHPTEHLYSARIHELFKDESLFERGIELARGHQAQALRERWLTPGFEDWEMSTQLLIKEAIKRGIRVEPIDAHDNIIKLTDADGRIEYVQQATKTSADSYITPLLMNNKVVTKKILGEAGINVPRGVEFVAKDAEVALRAFVDKPCVIKPKSTNFGQGVTMFEHGADLEALMEATKVALAFDSVIIAEEFIAGKEYRFLVIGGKVAGVLHRAPAQVKGDGVSTIERLVELKNQHPYRSTGYRTPLISIQLGASEREYLARRGYTPASVPARDEVVLLRPNSNISTGGDSYDVTDVVAPYFKAQAEAAARAFHAAFCGVDMIIENLEDECSPWGIIEVNFNPAIHIHSFPMEGKERNIASLVLDTIFQR